MGNKMYVLDTNVLLTDPRSLFSFEENDVVIPFQSLEELDSKKNRQDSTGKNAREVIRYLDDFRTQGSLKNGVSISENHGEIYVLSPNGKRYDLPENMDFAKADNRIILTFRLLQEKFSNKNIRLVTNDINLRVKCSSLGIECEEYSNIQVVNEVDSIYKGHTKVQLSSDRINDYREQREFYLSPEEVDQELYPNQFVTLVPEGRKISGALGRFVGYDRPL